MGATTKTIEVTVVADDDDFGGFQLVHSDFDCEYFDMGEKQHSLRI